VRERREKKKNAEKWGKDRKWDGEGKCGTKNTSGEGRKVGGGWEASKVNQGKPRAAKGSASLDGGLKKNLEGGAGEKKKKE